VAARTATAHLLATGRRRVAAVGLQPHLANQTAAQRLTGYRRALHEAGHRPDARLEVVVQRLHRADGAHAMQHLLALDEPPDAVFCFTDVLALGAMRVAWELGVRRPTTWRSSASTTSRTAAGPRPSLSTFSPTRRCSPRSPSTGCSSGSAAAAGGPPHDTPARARGRESSRSAAGTPPERVALRRDDQLVRVTEHRAVRSPGVGRDAAPAGPSRARLAVGV
jgi:hypothetical protein